MAKNKPTRTETPGCRTFRDASELAEELLTELGMTCHTAPWRKCSGEKTYRLVSEHGVISSCLTELCADDDIIKTVGDRMTKLTGIFGEYHGITSHAALIVYLINIVDEAEWRVRKIISLDDLQEWPRWDELPEAQQEQIGKLEVELFNKAGGSRELLDAIRTERILYLQGYVSKGGSRFSTGRQKQDWLETLRDKGSVTKDMWDAMLKAALANGRAATVSGKQRVYRFTRELCDEMGFCCAEFGCHK